MSKAELIKAIEEEEDPIVLGVVEGVLKGRPNLPVFDMATIDKYIDQDEEEIAKFGTLSVEEVRRNLLGKA